MTQRPAEQLVTELEKQIATGVHWVTNAQLRRWLKLAKLIDGRMRLDGSRLNKRPSVRKEAKRKRAPK